MLPKIYQCPSNKKHACSWEGLSENIVDHFNNYHEKLIWFTNTIPIDLNSPLTPENHLVFIETELYLLQVKIVAENLHFYLRILGPDSIARQKSFDINLESNGKVLDKSHIHMKSDCFDVSLESLENCFGQLTCIDCVISIAESNEKEATKFFRSFSEYYPQINEDHQKSENKSVIYENINPTKESKGLSRSYTLGVQHLKNTTSSTAAKQQSNVLSSMSETTTVDPNIKCVNCNSNLIRTIFLCESNHNICQMCSINRNDCNLCNGKITKQRNFPLEEKLKNALYSCKNKCNGCMEQLQYEEILKHQNICTFCTYICPIECGFKSTYKSMVNHLNLIHKSVKMVESFIAVFHNYTEVFLIQERCNGIFYCKVESDDEKVRWKAKFAGKSDRKFFYELRFKKIKLRSPLFLKKCNDGYMLEMTHLKLRELKVKWKNSILTINN